MSSHTNDDITTPLVQGDKNARSHNRSRGHLPGKPTSKTFVTICILVTELCERLTFYGITANLVPFCKDMLGMTETLPSTVNLLFQGTCYLIPVLGGWLADKYTGRFNLIYCSSLVYFVGTLLLSAVSVEDKYYKKYTNGSYLKHDYKIAYFVIALVFLAFGTGGIKANVSPFGADQVREQGPGAIQKFFNWFYWFINIGSFISFTLVVFIQQQSGFFQGYIITAGSMFLGVIAFCISRNKYVAHPPGGSTLGDTFKVILCAMKRTRKKENIVPRIKGESWLDRAKETRGGQFSSGQVEDVKALLRIMPIFAMFIIYWTLYSQMQTTYLIQAQYMKIHFGISFPAASLSIFDIIAVLILIPFMDKVVYPLLRYIGFHFTPLRRVGVGMIFAASSVAVAGLIEIKRRERFNEGHQVPQKLFNKNITASDMPIFYQVPQFLLIGTSEVFTSITGLEFAYSQAPRCLQGLVMGIFLVTSGIGNYLSSALANIVAYANPDWYPANDPNKGHFEFYFFFLAGLMLVNFLIFLIVAWNYKYVDHRKRGTSQNSPRWDRNSTQSNKDT